MGIQFTGLASGLDTQSIVSDLMKVERTKVEKVEKEKTLVEWKKEAWDEVNTELYGFFKDELFDFKSSGTYSKKTLTSSNESIIKMNGADSDVNGSFAINVTSTATSAFVTGSQLFEADGTTGITSEKTAGDLLGFADPDIKTITVSVDGEAPVDIDILAGDTMAIIANKIEGLDIGIKADFDSTFNRFFISTEDTGDAATIQFGGDAAALNDLGISSTQSKGSDAVFEYNGTELRSATNEVSVNGLSFNITGEGSANISVTQDIDAIYESVKNFITKYNELLVKFDDLVDAEYVSDDYKPLTSDEKAAMTEDDIELWETKIKDSILRRDDTLAGISSTMRNTLTLSSGVDTSDFTYKTISDLGIVTSGWQEAGVLHIHGDEDDSLYSLKDNKLREAIEEDPDAVMELLTGIGNQLYDNFQDRMKSTTLSSALTFYNDKFLDEKVDDYEDDIYDLEEMMVSVESRYYSQFTAMEQAIQQSNSTGDWLAQQLAGL